MYRQICTCSRQTTLPRKNGSLCLSKLIFRRLQLPLHHLSCFPPKQQVWVCVCVCVCVCVEETRTHTQLGLLRPSRAMFFTAWSSVTEGCKVRRSMIPAVVSTSACRFSTWLESPAFFWLTGSILSHESDILSGEGRPKRVTPTFPEAVVCPPAGSQKNELRLVERDSPDQTVNLVWSKSRNYKMTQWCKSSFICLLLLVVGNRLSWFESCAALPLHKTGTVATVVPFILCKFISAWCNVPLMCNSSFVWISCERNSYFLFSICNAFHVRHMYGTRLLTVTPLLTVTSLNPLISQHTTHMYIHMRKNRFIWPKTHTCTSTYMHVCMCIHIYIYIYIHTHTDAEKKGTPGATTETAQDQSHPKVCVCVCVSVCVSVCV
jgi:hypothetical protein